MTVIEEYGFERYRAEVSWRGFREAHHWDFKGYLFLFLGLKGLAKASIDLIAWLCSVFNVRFIRFPCFAFGHLLLEPDLFLKEKALGLAPKHRFLWLIDKQKICNPALLKIWRKKIPSLRIPFLDFGKPPLDVIFNDSRIFLDTTMYMTAVNLTGKFGNLQARWGDREQLLKLPEDIKAEGYQKLSALGFPKDGWFACIHCRESTYHRSQPDQDFRNGRVETYQAAIDFVISQGGWVIRLGDSSMSRLSPRDGLIDYPHTELRSDRMDLFFAGECKYIVGACSGPASASAAFGKPQSMANCLPFSTVPFYSYNGLGIGIPKLLYSEDEGRLLSFRESMESPVGNYRYRDLYEKDHLTMIDNDEDDILSLAKEMHAMAEGSLELSAEDQKRQDYVRSLFREGHYGYKSDCLFSPAFLRKYDHLLKE